MNRFGHVTAFQGGPCAVAAVEVARVWHEVLPIATPAGREAADVRSQGLPARDSRGEALLRHATGSRSRLVSRREILWPILRWRHRSPRHRVFSFLALSVAEPIDRMPGSQLAEYAFLFSPVKQPNKSQNDRPQSRSARGAAK